jgi:hypothetical protein
MFSKILDYEYKIQALEHEIYNLKNHIKYIDDINKDLIGQNEKMKACHMCKHVNTVIDHEIFCNEDEEYYEYDYKCEKFSLK